MNPLDLIALLRQRYPDTAIHLAYHPDADPGDESGWCVEVEEVGRHFGTLEAAFRAALANPRGGPPTLIPSAPEDLRAEIRELRLTLAAERGDPAGAPDPAWTWMGDGWEREYPCGERAAVYRKRWYRAVSGKPARVFGESPNLRAGMIACDAAISPLTIPCPTCDAPAGARCRDLPPKNVPDRDGNHDHVGRVLPEPHPARVAAKRNA